MNISINGEDLSGYFSPNSVYFNVEKVNGQNGGTSMGGSEIIDLVAVKSVIELTSGLLTEEQYRKIVALSNLDYVTVSYDNPDTGGADTKVMIPTRGPAQQIPLLGGGYAYKNLKLNLRER